MKLATFLPPDSRAPVGGEIRDGKAIAFADGDTVLGKLSQQGIRPAAGREWDLQDVLLLAPVPWPRAIFGIGLNYADHARETGQELPEKPIVFTKLPMSSSAPNSPVLIPTAVTKRLDYEGELVAVLGPDAHIAGYAIADDLSARDLQKREPQWARAKGFDGSCPWGPWITTVDEISDPGSLAVRTWVNDDLRQDGSTSDLVFSAEECVAFIAETCTLTPGDLVLTGTPAGVGQGMDPPQFLASGDVVRIEIEGLGDIEHPVRW